MTDKIFTIKAWNVRNDVFTRQDDDEFQAVGADHFGDQLLYREVLPHLQSARTDERSHEKMHDQPTGKSVSIFIMQKEAKSQFLLVSWRPLDIGFGNSKRKVQERGLCQSRSCAHTHLSLLISSQSNQTKKKESICHFYSSAYKSWNVVTWKGVGIVYAEITHRLCILLGHLTLHSCLHSDKLNFLVCVKMRAKRATKSTENKYLYRYHIYVDIRLKISVHSRLWKIVNCRPILKSFSPVWGCLRATCYTLFIVALTIYAGLLARRLRRLDCLAKHNHAAA